jgi:hypothetical protein
MIAILLFLGLFTGTVYAQDSGETALMLEPEAVPQRRVLKDLNLLLNSIPLPLITGGAGGAIEFKRFAPFTLWFGFERDGWSSNPIAVFSEEKKSTSDNRFVGARFYREDNASGPYLGLGYKWAEVESEIRPAFLNGVDAREEESAYGMYGGAGWRFIRQDPRMSYMVDLGFNLEPGYVKRMTYVEKQGSIFGATQAEIDTDVGYGVFAEGRFGLNF